MLKYEFVWDDAKALANERKHGITLELGASAFEDPLIEFSRIDHENVEQRWSFVGETKNRVLVFVVFTIDEEEYRVRIISARRATPHERREYESGEYSVREPEMTDEYDMKPALELKADHDYDDGTKDEFDFSKAKRGVLKNCRMAIGIDHEVIGYFHTRPGDTTEAINEILRVHVGLPAKRTEPVESVGEALRRHFGLPPPKPAKPSRTPGAGDGAGTAERR
jgi:uncharacterized protein